MAKTSKLYDLIKEFSGTKHCRLVHPEGDIIFGDLIVIRDFINQFSMIADLNNKKFCVGRGLLEVEFKNKGKEDLEIPVDTIFNLWDAIELLKDKGFIEVKPGEIGKFKDAV